MRRVAMVAAFAALVGVVGVGAVAQQQPTGTSGSSSSMGGGIMFVPSEAKWSPAPPLLPSGSEVTVLQGDPSSNGQFALQLKMPDGYKIAPHWHPSDERLTVVKGAMKMGMGKKWDEDDMKALPVGGFVFLPGEHPHYLITQGETIVQVEGKGPFTLTYVNPSDDPQKK